MSPAKWILRFTSVATCSLVCGAAPAEDNGALTTSEVAFHVEPTRVVEPMRVVDTIDPWAEEGGSKPSIAASTISRSETLDPWRVRRPTTWMRVSSGLEPSAARIQASASRAQRAPTHVISGLDVAARESSCAVSKRPESWIHVDIIDPWARSSRAAFPLP
ncbi:MAG: hypothetical protein ACOY0T_21925 [Myxococcota bacterium]